MTHAEVVQALAWKYPDVEWSYDGDGSTLDAVADTDGAVISRGLEWHSSDVPMPTLADVQEAFTAAQAAIVATSAASRIRGALAATDIWCARHIEDGVSLTPERIAYRQELRALLELVGTSDDAASIEIPDAPPPPKS